MRQSTALTALFAIAAISCAHAQDYPGDEVTVNPNAVGQLLIDPATGQPRYYPPRREPWRNTPVHLHMPKGYHPEHRTATERPAREATETPAPVVHRPRVVRERPPAERPAEPQTASPAASNLNDLANLTQAPAETRPVVRRAAAPKPVEPKPVERKPVARPPKPEAVASIPRAPARTAPTSPGKPRDVVLFALGATDPSTSAINSIQTLVNSLSNAMMSSSTRLELVAYGGPRGEKSSDTRRLSLKRALIVRQLLIDDGISSERIDVRAMGGVEDDGPPDRVDIFVKG